MIKSWVSLCQQSWINEVALILSYSISVTRLLLSPLAPCGIGYLAPLDCLIAPSVALRSMVGKLLCSFLVPC